MKKRTVATYDDRPDRVLTVREVAQFLRVSPGTIYRMIHARTIPGAFRVLGSWRLNAEQLDRWIKTVEHTATSGMKKTDRE